MARFIAKDHLSGARIADITQSQTVMEIAVARSIGREAIIGSVLTGKGGMTMTDLAKVIKGLEVCTSNPCYCTDCPYKANCCLDSQEVMEDALSLLKEQNKAAKAKEYCDILEEQEPKAIVYKENWMTGLPVAICPKCGKFAVQFNMAHAGEETKFCPWCGQAVKWE